MKNIKHVTILSLVGLFCLGGCTSMGGPDTENVGAAVEVPYCVDPCTEGAVVVPAETYPRVSGTPMTSHRNFDLDVDSDVCVVLKNDGCGSAEVKIEGNQMISPGQLNPNVSELFATTHLAAGSYTLSVRVASADGCSVEVSLRACNPEPPPPLCSDQATVWCEAKGWHVAYYWQGSVICTAPGYDEYANCEDCNIYNIVVWVDGAGDPLCPGGLCSTDAGSVYGGHEPCECGDNLRYCQTWDMQGCQPD